MNAPRWLLAISAALLLPVAANGQADATREWVAQSDRHARVLLDVAARLAPESASDLGIEGLDEAIGDLSPGYEDRAIAANRAAIAQLEALLKVETHPQVRQDLTIMIQNAADSITGTELGRKYSIPYVNVGATVFAGVRALLDDRVAPERRPAALVRLRKYAGLEPGTTPRTGHAIALTRGRRAIPGLFYPPKAAVERGLADTQSYLAGIAELFEKYKIAGSEQPLAALTSQLAEYDAFVRAEILPQARTDFRSAPEVYAYLLKRNGVDIAPAELVTRARAAFTAIQADMQALAPTVARERGWAITDYRSVIRELKKEQLTGAAILPHYQERLGQIEAIIRRERLITIPNRAARIRLATAAETAASPAPSMRPPRMIGNTGEQGEFVLPLNVPTTDGRTLQTDDFTFAAASWTLTAHEARPGHELQFARMIEVGVSTARATFAFNSTNAEGWGLYAEHVLLPFMPADGRLVSLQHRLLRAARAFLDPELQAGTIAPDDAFALLTNDVVLSEGMARQEVDRYTFRQPAQAPTYFYGYLRLMELRADVERALGPKFDQRAYHDFLLSQGLLPPHLLRAAVMEQFAGRR